MTSPQKLQAVREAVIGAKKHITRKDEGTWMKYSVVDSRGKVRMVTDSYKKAKEKLAKIK